MLELHGAADWVSFIMLFYFVQGDGLCYESVRFRANASATLTITTNTHYKPHGVRPCPCHPHRQCMCCVMADASDCNRPPLRAQPANFGLQSPATAGPTRQ